MNSKARIVRDGAIAGALGAATVALWFMIFDLSRGAPVETPALLASVLLHGSAGSVAALVAEYTVFHFAAFIAFGIGIAILLEAAERHASLLPALVIMTAVFEGLFVGIVMYFAREFQGSLSWWSVMVGNLLATAVMAAYFFALHPHLAYRLFGPWMSVLAEGASAGFIGAAMVVLWFFFRDIASGTSPLHTPAVLGGAILEGSRNAAAFSSPVVIAYTVLHFAVFVAFGVAAASLAASLEEPLLYLGFLLMFALFQVFFVGFASILNGALLDQLGWGAIVGGNLLAAAAMLAFFYSRRAALHSRAAAWNDPNRPTEAHT